MSLNRATAATILAGVACTSPAAAEDTTPVEVVVSGAAPTPFEARDPTAATYVIRRDDLRAPGLTSADALSRVPGVEVTRSGAASELSTAALRGATAAQTPVYLAGIRLNDDLTGTADLSTVPLWMLDRVEVYRGSAPFEADRLGIGGAIFLEPARPKVSRVGAGGGLGSFGETSGWASGSVAGKNGAVLLALRRDSAKNDYPYVDDAGTRFVTSDDVVKTRANADSTSYDGWATGHLSFAPRAELLFLSNVFVREQGVTGLSSDPARAARLRTARVLGGVSSRIDCSSDQGEPCMVELVTSALATDQHLSDPERKFGLQSTSADTRGQRIAQHQRLRVAIGPAVSLTVAGSVEAERLQIDDAEGPTLRARREVERFASTTSWRATDDVELVALGALTCDKTTGPGQGRGCNPSATGRAGASVRPWPGATLSANIGRYDRVPTLGERYGLSAALRGNASLLPEAGWTVDFGARWSHRNRTPSPWRLYAEAFGFTRFVSNLIGYERSSFNAATAFNLRSARVSGLELSAGGEALEVLRAELVLTALDPRDTTPGRTLTNDMLPFHSRLVVSPLVEVFAEPAARPAGLDRVSLGARAFYRSSEYADKAGTVVIPEQLAVDLDLGLSFLRRALALHLRVANIFDAPSFDVVGYPLPGRSFHASIEAWW